MNTTQHSPHTSMVRRQASTADVWISHASAFTTKLIKQLGLTLFATLLGAGRDYLLTKSSAEVSKRLSGNMGGRADDDRNKVYSPSSNYNSGYDNNQYNRYRANGSETFPGF